MKRPVEFFREQKDLSEFLDDPESSKKKRQKRGRVKIFT